MVVQNQQSDQSAGGSPVGIAHQTAKAIVRRRFVEGFGRWMVWTFVFAIVGIGLSRLVGWATGSQWWWGWIVLAVVGALVPAMIYAMRNRMTDAQGGGLLDDRLGLKSQIRSAIELETDTDAEAQSPGFVAMAKAHAKTLASDVEVAQAMPVMDTKDWTRATALLVVAIVMGIWLPMIERGQSSEKLIVPSSAIAKLDTATETLEALDEGEEESQEVQEAIEELEALKEELASGVDDQSQANARAAAKLEEIADELDEQAAEEQAAAQELSGRLAQAQNQSTDEGMDDLDQQLDEFSEAIQDQRYEDADERFDELKEQLDQLSDAEREALADRLEELANAVEPDSVEDDPAKDLADSIRDEAEDIREPQESDQEEPQADDESSGEDDSENQGAADDKQEQEGESESEERDDDSDGESEQTEDEGQEEGKQGESESTDEGESEGEKQSENESEQEGSEESTGQREQEGGDDSSEQQMKGEEEAEDGSQEGDRQGERSVEDALEEMQERKERARKRQEQSEKIREQAKELIDPEQSPDEQEEGDRLGVRKQEMQEENKGGAGDEPREEGEPQAQSDSADGREFVPVDASDTDANGSGDPVGKWYAPDGEAGNQVRADETVERLRNASQKAQRAVDEQQVPRKYRQLVRDTFKRVSERADAIESGGKVAPQGKDAVSNSEQPAKKTDSKE